MSFFPEGVQVETPSRYTKLGKGTTTLRMIGEPLFFFETWINNDDGSRSPKRFAQGEEIPLAECGPDGVKQVMAIKVYNYNAKMIQVWSVNQKTIMQAIKAYSENKKYGDPTGYDINIEKTGEGKQTRYNVIADPKEPLSPAVEAASKALSVNLNALLIGGDPFGKDKSPATVNKADLEIVTEKKEDEDLPF